MKRRTFVRDLTVGAASLPLLSEAKLQSDLDPPPATENTGPWLYAPTPDHCPPDDDVVWTSDGLTVRLGRWTWQPQTPLGIWNATDGRTIMVTHWCFTDDVDDPPAVPSDTHTARVADLCARAPLGLDAGESVGWFVQRGIPEFHARMLVFAPR